MPLTKVTGKGLNDSIVDSKKKNGDSIYNKLKFKDD